MIAAALSVIAFRLRNLGCLAEATQFHRADQILSSGARLAAHSLMRLPGVQWSTGGAGRFIFELQRSMSILDERETCGHLSAALKLAIEPPHRHRENRQFQLRSFLCVRRCRAFWCGLAAQLSTAATRFGAGAVAALSHKLDEITQVLIGDMLDLRVMRFADEFLLVGTERAHLLSLCDRHLVTPT